MKKLKKISTMLLAVCLIVLMAGSVLAHSGRTDSNGGHRDNQNKSGLGSYHYHCGGYPAHLHKGGVCPYKSSSKKKTTTKKKSTTVKASKIKINELEDTTLEVGESLNLSAKITPSNTKDKTIKWTSSDKEIATVNSKGKVVAVSAGTVTITATTSNNKKSSIKIIVEEKEEVILEENNVVENMIEENIIEENLVEEVAEEKVVPIISTEVVSNAIANETRESSTTATAETTDDTGDTILGLGVLGAGGYWLYNKRKKSKQETK
mgnify:CR=1 FL=1